MTVAITHDNNNGKLQILMKNVVAIMEDAKLPKGDQHQRCTNA